MKKNLFLLGIILTFFFTSCNKPKITCDIVKPLPNTTFEIGDIIDLAVTVDVENTTISEVQIYLDDVGYDKKFVFPFNFKINTTSLEQGAHTIRVVAIANSGTKDEKTIAFNVTKYESPDFVSFSDGTFPKGWEHEGWTICSPGYDDNYAIGGNPYYYISYLSTVKECNASKIDCIEFYAKKDESWYTARLAFRIDYGVTEVIELNETWTKYSFDVPTGEHTFSWWIQSGETYIYLDAIKFFKK